MTNEQIIYQLESLLDHCQSMISDDDDNMWKADVEALTAAIGRVKAKEQLDEQIIDLSHRLSHAVAAAEKWSELMEKAGKVGLTEKDFEMMVQEHE